MKLLSTYFREAFGLLAVAVCACGAPFQTEPNDWDDDWPTLTCEDVATKSPDELIDYWKLRFCECGQDHFYTDYAATLEPECDRLDWRCIGCRENLCNAFAAVVRIDQTGTGGGTGHGHEMARILGRVEHILYSGIKNHFFTSGQIPRSINDLERLLETSDRKYDLKDFEDAVERREKIKLEKNGCIEFLQRAEAALSEREAGYLRIELYKYINDWLSPQS